MLRVQLVEGVLKVLSLVKQEFVLVVLDLLDVQVLVVALVEVVSSNESLDLVLVGQTDLGVLLDISHHHGAVSAVHVVGLNWLGQLGKLGVTQRSLVLVMEVLGTGAAEKQGNHV